jgi:hypothetical protein
MEQSHTEPNQAPAQRVAASVLGKRSKASAPASDPRARVNRIAKGVLLGVVLLGIGVGLFFRFKTARFTNLASPDAIQSAQIAYNVHKHRSLTTSITYPLVLAGARPDVAGHDLGGPPAYPVALGLFFHLRGNSDDGVVMFNALCMFALAWVLYGIVCLAFDRNSALWSVLAYFGSVPIIGMALIANGVLLTALFFSLAIFLALHAMRRSSGLTSAATEESASATPPRVPWPWLVGVGLCAGMAYLSGYFSPLLWLLLAGVAAASMGRARRPVAATILGIALLFGLAWWGRNLVLTGRPWSLVQMSQLVMGTHEYPSQSVLGSLSDAPANPALYLLTHPQEALRKMAINGVEVYKAVPDLANLYLWPFLAIFLLTRPKTAEQRLLRTVFLWGLGIQGVTTILTTGAADPLGILRPIAIGASVAALVQWLRGIEMTRVLRLVSALAVIVVLGIPYVASLVMAGPVRTPSLANVSQMPRALDLKDKTVFLTDNPWITAWYGHYRSVLLPKQPQDLGTIASAGRAPHLIYLTANGVRALKAGGPEDPWTKFLSDRKQTAQLGMMMPLPGKELELLILTPPGAQELPGTKTAMENYLKGLQERQRQAASGAAQPASPAQATPDAAQPASPAQATPDAAQPASPAQPASQR